MDNKCFELQHLTRESSFTEYSHPEIIEGIDVEDNCYEDEDYDGIERLNVGERFTDSEDYLWTRIR